MATIAPADLLLAVTLGPDTRAQRGLSHFVEALAHGLGTGPASMDPDGIAAGFLDRRDAAVAGHGLGGREAIALRAPGRRRARRQEPGRRRENCPRWPRRPLEQTGPQCAYYTRPEWLAGGQFPCHTLGLHRLGQDHRRVGGQRLGLSQQLEPLLDQLLGTAMVAAVELAQPMRSGLPGASKVGYSWRKAHARGLAAPSGERICHWTRRTMSSICGATLGKLAAEPRNAPHSPKEGHIGQLVIVAQGQLASAASRNS